MCRDPEFGPVRLRAFGTYSMRVSDPGKFMTEIVGTDGEFTADEISFQIRNVIVQEFSRRCWQVRAFRCWIWRPTPPIWARSIATAIAPQVAEYGLSLPEFYIENISLPEEVEKALDKRTSMGIVGDLNKYMQFNAAEGMASPELRRGRRDGRRHGRRDGHGHGAKCWALGGCARRAAPPPPPPPRRQAVWHIAENGATTGPFRRSDPVRQMAAKGSLTAATHGLDRRSGRLESRRQHGACTRCSHQHRPPPPGG